MSAALIGALGALGSSLLGNQASKDAQDDQNNFNLQMYQQYKSPEAMSRQLRNAGLNPAFALQQIATGMTETPTQSSPRDTSAMSNLGGNLTNALMTGSQADLAKQQAKAQQIENGWIDINHMLNMNRMIEETKGLKFDNYIKDQSKDMQVNIIKQQELQQYTKTYVDNLLAVGSEWDVASKAMFAKIGQPLQFEKMRYDIAATGAQLNYQLKVNKWYDKFSKAQIDSLYSNAAAALIDAHANSVNAGVNKYLAPQINKLNQEKGLSESWNRRKDKSLFSATKQSLENAATLSGYQVHDLNYGLNPVRRWLGIGSSTPNLLLTPGQVKQGVRSLKPPVSIKGFR